MSKYQNPYEAKIGADRLNSPVPIIALLLFVAIAVFLIDNSGLAAGVGLLMLPFILTYLIFFFKYPVVGFYSTIVLGYILLGSARYVKLGQIGLAMDGILVMTYLALIFNRFRDRIDWTPAKKDITLLGAIWFGYAMFQAVNPESRSLAAWMSGMRGISMYMFLMIPLALLLIDTRKKLDIFFIIWGLMALLATTKGIMQMTLGVDKFEKAWLDAGGAVTHILFGKLRVFSFMSDAGQFGANQGYSAVVALIIAFAEKKRLKFRLFFGLVAIMGLYGMIISGTRGAISVPLGGAILYFIHRKNKYVMISGAIVMIMGFIFFKYTTIGQDNQQIRRMRSAFDPNDASLQVRLANQKKLKIYLASRPFGGGIGHAGVKAQKYLPNAFLSNVATDSWYVLIWAEQGIVGLLLHLFILFYVIIRSSYLIMFRIRDPIVRLKMSAMASGMFGVMIASYGNAVLGTMPTGMLIYTSMALLLSPEKFDVEAFPGEKQELKES